MGGPDRGLLIVIFHIHHTTMYRFSQPVFLEPHALRLQPRVDGGQKLRSFRLTVEPTPQGAASWLDAEGNTVQHLWFDRLWSQLTLATDCEVETLRVDPFDYLLTRENNEWPVQYAAATREKLSAALRRAERISPKRDRVTPLMESIRREGDGTVVSFLTRLTAYLYENFQVAGRAEGPPHPPQETLGATEVACRDLAWLWVDACRAAGLAARFVSGYQEGDPEQDQRDLHAWGEVYLPGAGWRAFDATHGMAVADRHVAVAAACHPQDAAPVTGSFRGTGATVTIHHEIGLRAGSLPSRRDSPLSR